MTAWSNGAWVHREEDPTDRRQKLASLTPTAETRLLRMEQGRSLMIQRLLRRMAVDDLRALRQGIVALVAVAARPVEKDPKAIRRVANVD